MRHLATFVIVLIALAACTQFTLVDGEKTQTIGKTYTVVPQISWNKATEGKMETWTVNGPSLEAVRFFKGLGDGDTLFELRRKPGQKEPKVPVYREGMAASEIMEFVVDSLSRGGLSDVQASGLRPAQFGSVPGFRFELALVSGDGLKMDGLAVGAVIEDKLHLILYTGARLHYFPKYRDPVERLIASIEMT